jgi:hypothetical protein
MTKCGWQSQTLVRNHETNTLSIATAFHGTPSSFVAYQRHRASAKPSITIVPPFKNADRRLTFWFSAFLANTACECDISVLTSANLASYSAGCSYVTAGLAMTELTPIFIGEGECGVIFGNIFVGFRESAGCALVVYQSIVDVKWNARVIICRVEYLGSHLFRHRVSVCWLTVSNQWNL